MFLEEKFGKAGPYYYWIARGIEERPVRAERERKSVGAEDTFASDLFEFESARRELAPLVAKVWRYCEERSIKGRNVMLKVKFADFQQRTRSRSLSAPVGQQALLRQAGLELIRSLLPPAKGVRLLGVSVSNFGDGGCTLPLLDLATPVGATRASVP